MRSFCEQLRAAFESSQMTLGELIRKSELGISRPSMSKKLRGKQPMTLDEGVRIARALGLQVQVGRSRRVA